MHWQHNGASCGKRQPLRNDRGRYLPWSFNKRSKRKGKPPCRKGRESKKNNNKNHGIFRCLCLHHPWPLLHKSQGSVIAQTSCKVRCLYGGMFIAGVVFFWGSCEMTPGGFFSPASVHDSNLTVQHRTVGVIPGWLQLQDPSRTRVF